MNPSHVGAPAICARCERLRPIQGWGLCVACYWQRRRRGLLPVRLPRGGQPCQECGLQPCELRYAHRTSRGLRQGRCHACAQRYYRAEQARRWATPQYILENAS